MKLLALVLAVFTATACGAQKQRVVRTARISASYPAGWHATGRRLTSVTYPPEVLAVASYPIAQKAPDGDCSPSTALDALPARGALIVVIEYIRPSPFGPIRPRDFPPRPSDLRLGRVANYECAGRSSIVRFRAAGRFFQADVTLGRHAGSSVRATVLRILTGLRVQPSG